MKCYNIINNSYNLTSEGCESSLSSKHTSSNRLKAQNHSVDSESEPFRFPFLAAGGVFTLSIRSSYGPGISGNLSDYATWARRSGKAPWWGIVSPACLEKLAAAWKMDGASTPSCLSLIRCHPRSASREAWAQEEEEEEEGERWGGTNQNPEEMLDSSVQRRDLI